MERHSKFMDWNSQSYMAVILPQLIYVIPIKCLLIVCVKLYKLNVKFTEK